MKKKIAGIMTESGIITFFEILCRVAQGDSPTGHIFILALEPLLWKLSLDLGVDHLIFANCSHVRDSSYADDISTLINVEPEKFYP